MKRTLLIASSLVAASIVLTLAGFEIHKTAIIVVNDQVIPVEFWGFKVEDALSASGIKVHQEDIINPPPDTSVRDEQIVTVTPASWIVIAADGKTNTLWTAERVPEQILDQLDLHLNPGDELVSSRTLIKSDQPLPYKSAHTLQVKRASRIHLIEGGSTVQITSTASTLGTALWEAGIKLYQADRLAPPLETRLSGQEISAALERSRQGIIQYQGISTHYRVLADTTGEALAEAGLPLQGLNFSIPPEDDPIPEDGLIRIVHIQEKTILEQDFLPFGLEYQPLSDLQLDSQQVVQVGEYGLLAKRIRIVTEDGQEISRETEDEWVAKHPKPRIIGYGTRIDIQITNTPDGPIQYYRAVDAYATSYSPCRIGVPDQCSNRTASGAELKKGVIGVIRSWYNVMKGAPVYIPGYGYATIQDIGAGFSDRHWVDLGYTDDDWVSWSSYVTVYFLAPAPANIIYILE